MYTLWQEEPNKVYAFWSLLPVCNSQVLNYKLLSIQKMLFTAMDWKVTGLPSSSERHGFTWILYAVK